MTEMLFREHTDAVLTGREPGVAKIDWSPGVLDDGSLAWDSCMGGREPHLLIGGSAGSGKTVLLSSMISQLAFNNGPSEVRLWIVEPKTDMQPYRDLDITERFIDSWSPGENYLASAADLLEDAVEEMQRRDHLLLNHRRQPKTLFSAREIARQESAEADTAMAEHPLYLPYLLIFLGESATLFAEPASKEDRRHQERLVAAATSLAKGSRQSGIFLVTETSYVAEASVPSEIRAQMRRIGMRCHNTIASLMLIGEAGLEDVRLKGAGKLVHQGRWQNFRGHSPRMDFRDFVKQD